MTTSPLPRQTSEGVVDPFSKDFSAFVFKIQANMNKAHRRPHCIHAHLQRQV